jgi:site-specific recombinase XerD
MRRWDGLADGYIEEYKARGVSEDYITHVQREIERWGAWLKRRRPRPRLEEISPDLHVRYVQDRTAFRARSTVYGAISKMRGFGDYLVTRGVWPDNPLKWMQGPKLTPYHRMPKRIDGKDMKALWSAAATGRGHFQRHLGITILSILYGTGLRRGELARLNVSDWNRDDGTLRIDGQKTGQERIVPVPRVVYHCIETYLPHRQNHLIRKERHDQPALFLNREGGRFKVSMVSLRVRNIAKRAKVKLHSVHQFRHSCASDLLASGASIAEVQRILGHSSVATTVRYLHIADPERHEAMKRHPLNDWLMTEAA